MHFDKCTVQLHVQYAYPDVLLQTKEHALPTRFAARWQQAWADWGPVTMLLRYVSAST